MLVLVIVIGSDLFVFSGPLYGRMNPLSFTLRELRLPGKSFQGPSHYSIFIKYLVNSN